MMIAFDGGADPSGTISGLTPHILCAKKAISSAANSSVDGGLPPITTSKVGFPSEKRGNSARQGDMARTRLTAEKIVSLDDVVIKKPATDGFDLILR